MQYLCFISFHSLRYLHQIEGHFGKVEYSTERRSVLAHVRPTNHRTETNKKICKKIRLPPQQRPKWRYQQTNTQETYVNHWLKDRKTTNWKWNFNENGCSQFSAVTLIGDNSKCHIFSNRCPIYKLTEDLGNFTNKPNWRCQHITSSKLLHR